MKVPPRSTGEAQRACTAAASTASASSGAPIAAQASATARPAPSWAGAAESTSWPARRYQASTPWASHHSPIARTESPEARPSASAAASPKRSRTRGAECQRLSTNPPLRPDGPWPQRSPSSSTTSAPRSASSHAVHIPA